MGNATRRTYIVGLSSGMKGQEDISELLLWNLLHCGSLDIKNDNFKITDRGVWLQGLTSFPTAVNKCLLEDCSSL